MANAAKALSQLGNKDKAFPEPDLRRIVASLQAALADPSPLVRYRAFEGLDYISNHSVSPSITSLARAAVGNYDPRADEIKALGGPSTFQDWKPK